MRASTRAGGLDGSSRSRCARTGSSRARRHYASASPSCCCRCACLRRMARNSRTNSPAASASASRSRAPSPRTRNFSCATSPTSALDVSVQAQILNLMKDLQRQLGLTYLFISHNLAVIYQMSDRVGVMYLGRLVEIAAAEQLFAAPRHPYTRLLLDTIPSIEMTGREREPVAGEVPNPINPPAGCGFHPRCPFANGRCRRERPELIDDRGTLVACHAVEEGRLPVEPSVVRAG